MELANLERLVERGESTTLEFKKSHGGRREAGKTVCGMLNTQGGTVIFGVADDGRIVGQQVTAGTLEDVAQTLRKITPGTMIVPDVVELPNGRALIVLEVPKGQDGVYAYDGRPYRRVGASDQPMDRAQQQSLLLDHTSWERHGASRVSIEDLDGKEIKRTVEEAVRRGVITDPLTTAVDELLVRFGVALPDGELLNAAVVLFGKESAFLPDFPQVLLKLARFRGTTTTTALEDTRQVQGNIFELFSVAQSFLLQHLPVAGRIIPGVIEREDQPVYPLVALREAIANALCHRDYALASGSMSIAIFDDRLEIMNTGGLIGGLTVEDLMSGAHGSHPRNPLIANVLYKRGVIERFGTGTRRILDTTQQAGLPTPEFEEIANGSGFLVRFKPSAYMAPQKVVADLTPLQRELLQVLADHGPVRLADVLERVGRPKRTVQDNLKVLRGMGWAALEGKGRGARWIKL